MLTSLALDLGSVAQTVLGIGGLVFVHELGHFLVGRACGVRAEAFSIGFGPVVAKWKPGETEYRLSALPLGGYVKFAGENADERDGEDPRSFFAAIYPRKVAILLAGVTMNVLAAFVLFVAAFSGGVTTIAPVVGKVQAGSPAEAAGLRAGDRVLEMDGHRIVDFEDMVYGAAFAEEVELLVQREGTTLAPIRATTRLSDDGLRRLGIFNAQATDGTLAVDPDSAAFGAGVRPGDRLVEAGGKSAASLDDAWSALDPGAESLPCVVERDGERVTVALPVRTWMIGIRGVDDDRRGAGFPVKLEAVGSEPSAAAEAGLPAEFRILAADGVAVADVPALQEAVTAAGREGRELRLRWTPGDGGEATESSVRPRSVVAPGPEAMGVGAAPLVETVRESNVGAAVALGFDRTHRWVMRIFSTLRSLVTGQLSATKLSGPVRLTRDAYKVAQGEWTHLALFLGMLSMNLAVLNVLPIPLLDGGQLGLLTVEKLRGRPLPERVISGIQWTGLAVLLGFMVFVVANDIRNL